MGVDDQRQMQVARRRQAQRALQQDLAGGGVEQVRPAHDIGDPLFRIVHDHRQLVGPVAIRSAQDHIADVAVDRLRDAPLQTIDEVHGSAFGNL